MLNHLRASGRAPFAIARPKRQLRARPIEAVPWAWSRPHALKKLIEVAEGVGPRLYPAQPEMVFRPPLRLAAHLFSLDARLPQPPPVRRWLRVGGWTKVSAKLRTRAPSSRTSRRFADNG